MKRSRKTVESIYQTDGPDESERRPPSWIDLEISKHRAEMIFHFKKALMIPIYIVGGIVLLKMYDSFCSRSPVDQRSQSMLAQEQQAYPGLTSSHPHRLNQIPGTAKSSGHQARFLFDHMKIDPNREAGMYVAWVGSQTIKVHVEESIYDAGDSTGTQVFGHIIYLSKQLKSIFPSIKPNAKEARETITFPGTFRNQKVTYRYTLVFGRNLASNTEFGHVYLESPTLK